MQKLIAPIFLALGLMTGCAGTTADLVKTQNEELAELRVAMSGLREQEAVKTFRPELEKAASQLGQAEAKVATGDPDEEDVAMLISLARSQMVLVKSMVARSLAEGALKQISTDYGATAQTLRQLEAQQEAVDAELGDTP